MTKYPKDFNQLQKEQYDTMFSQVLDFPCKECGAKYQKIGLWKVKCGECEKKFVITKPRYLKIGQANSANWKATCDECGGKMSYFNFRYGCDKCGNVLEV